MENRFLKYKIYNNITAFYFNILKSKYKTLCWLNKTVQKVHSISSSKLLVGWQKWHPACKKTHTSNPQRFFFWGEGANV